MAHREIYLVLQKVKPVLGLGRPWATLGEYLKLSVSAPIYATEMTTEPCILDRGRERMLPAVVLLCYSIRDDMRSATASQMHIVWFTE